MSFIYLLFIPYISLCAYKLYLLKLVFIEERIVLRYLL